MLVLSRQKDEEIVIDFTKATDQDIADLRAGRKTIDLNTIDIRGDKVRHGISAPKSIVIDRKEIFDEKRRAK